ncbi:MAG: MFS transporter [Planctomycetes bacterium]|nr:MFS transporter [Planctomycetota bacterium]
MFNRAEVVDRNFVRFLGERGHAPGERVDPSAPVCPGCPLTGAALLELFESQMTARHLDLIARDLRAAEKGFYTISSAGHEGNAVLGRVTRHTDPAYVHYRSGAFMVERGRQVSGVNVVRDAILGMVASADEPLTGGRHKVWGSKALWVPPQTSTIGSHLPKAVGTAIAIGRVSRLGMEPPVPRDSIVLCSFGDATVNHSTAQGAFNAACYASFQHLPVPILFLCEDNELGISVRTAPGWIEETFKNRPGLTYFSVDGLDLVSAYAVAHRAVEYCRKHRSPVFLHFHVVRLLGHAGSDFEFEYRTQEQIEAAEAQDPLLSTARRVLAAGFLTAGELGDRYEAIRRHVREEADAALTRPRLESAQQVMAPLAPYHPGQVWAEAARVVATERRERGFGGEGRLPETGSPKHMAVQINRALFDLMTKYDEIVLFGQDVAQKGGVYHVTTGLAKRFGAARVFNTLLDEQTILGLAQGFGAMGLLPIPEIQYLAYYHNAEDQLRGEACSLQFFSGDQFRNPMVVRIASFGYQKGFGGHFHNDNSIAALRDIPGLIIAAPARGDDAAEMLRTAAALARVDGRVIAFLEPIALYMTKDLYERGDGGWLTRYPSPERFAPLGEGRVYGSDASDVVIITYANGVYLSLRAVKRLADQDGIKIRIVDLRWLNPLNADLIAHHASACGRVLVVDEGRRSGGLAEAVVTAIVEGCDPVPKLARVTGRDTYIPLGPAAELVLPSEDQIVGAVRDLITR